MPTTTAPSPINIRQESGPDFPVVSEMVPYYTEVISEFVGDSDAPQAEHIALAVSAGGSFSQPEFNKPIDWTANVARNLGRAADMITEGSMPIVSLDREEWSAAITEEGSSLMTIHKAGSYGWALSAEADSATPVLHSGSYRQLYAGGTTYRSGDPERKFATDPPGLVLTDDAGPKPSLLKAEVNEVLDEVTHDGILAVGPKGVNRLLNALARRELEEVDESQRQFGESSALRMLAYFREHGQRLALSRAKFVREAGVEAVSAVISGKADAGNVLVPGGRIGPIVARLGAVEFKPGDHTAIAEGVFKNMDEDQSREAFAGLAHTNGSTVEEYVNAQTSVWMGQLLGTGSN